MEHIKALPQEQYEVKKDQIGNRYIEKVSLKYPQLKGEELKNAKKKFLVKVFGA